MNNLIMLFFTELILLQIPTFVILAFLYIRYLIDNFSHEIYTLKVLDKVIALHLIIIFIPLFSMTQFKLLNAKSKIILNYPFYIIMNIIFISIVSLVTYAQSSFSYLKVLKPIVSVENNNISLRQIESTETNISNNES
jgi:hypothetical protein